MTRENILRATVTALGMHNLTPESGQGTSLGWTAKREFRVYDAGTELARFENSSRTPYTKTNNGWSVAIAFIHSNTDWGGNWCGVITASTELSASQFTGYGAVSSQQEYLGLQWYIWVAGQNAQWGGSTTPITDLPVLDFQMQQAVIINGNTIPRSTFLRIMEEAGVRLLPEAFTRPVLSERR